MPLLPYTLTAKLNNGIIIFLKVKTNQETKQHENFIYHTKSNNETNILLNQVTKTNMKT